MLAASSLCACSKKAEVQFSLSEDGTYYCVSGVSGNKDKLVEYDIPSVHTGEDGVSRPVKAVADDAFRECFYLRSVTIPSSVEYVGDRAFAYTGVTEIDLPEGVKEVGYAAFYCCDQLVKATVPQSVTELGTHVFYGCSSLETAYFYAQVEDMPEKTFYNSVQYASGNYYTASALESLYLGASVKSIDESALFGNPLRNIYYSGTQEQWAEVVFYKITTDENGESKREELDRDELLKNIKVEFNAQF